MSPWLGALLALHAAHTLTFKALLRSEVRSIPACFQTTMPDSLLGFLCRTHHPKAALQCQCAASRDSPEGATLAYSRLDRHVTHPSEERCAPSPSSSSGARRKSIGLGAFGFFSLGGGLGSGSASFSSFSGFRGIDPVAPLVARSSGSLRRDAMYAASYIGLGLFGLDVDGGGGVVLHHRLERLAREAEGVDVGHRAHAVRVLLADEEADLERGVVGV